MNLSIVIVNYKKYELTEKCINSVIKNLHELEYEIIVIDNNSPNSSYEYLKSKYKCNDYVKIIKNTSNEGFGMANNIGVRHSKSEYILLLNPDVIVLEDSITKMYYKLLDHSEIGLIGCKLLNKDMTLQYSCRRFLKFTEFICARTPLKKLFTKDYIEKLNNKYLMKDIEHDKELFVDWIMGSCMLLRKEIFNMVGGFSKEYFMYFEDVDLCYKINKIGKNVLYYPEAQMIHLHNQESTKKLNKLTFVHLNSMMNFYTKTKLENI